MAFRALLCACVYYVRWVTWQSDVIPRFALLCFLHDQCVTLLHDLLVVYQSEFLDKIAKY